MSETQFGLQVARFAEKAKGNAEKIVRKIVMDLGRSIVMRSPVGDPSHWMHPAPKGYTGGHFRANWQYAVGAAPRGIINAVDKSGKISIDRIVQGVNAGKAYGKVHWIVNNLPYAARLETGWSKQAPSGMVGLAVREYQMIVEHATKEARNS